VTTAVTVFCGGRGAASLTRALLARPGVDLSLVVNGYDNGLSTGALRRFLPGMLGVSDFRKNLVHHLDPADPHQAALRELLDRRLPAAGPGDALGELIGSLPPELRPDVRAALAADLARFDAHRAARGGFEPADCAVGNLVVAGAYLRLGRDFNAAVADVAATVGCPVRLLNVSDGRDAHLVAVKADGELLADEADIVAPQSAARIVAVALLPRPLDRTLLAGRSLPEQLAWLRGHSVPVPVDPAAAAAVADADLLVYGPGTHHSSLLPTYLTRGLGDRVRAGRARVRALVLNVRRDHDALALDGPDLLDSTLAGLGDPGNAGRTVTHVVYPRRRSADAPAVPAAIEESGTYRGARWVAADVEAGVHSGVHDGPRTAAVLADLLAEPAAALEGRA
jgi:2-phospho-L-lactate transferase/gluconeogenesis factor (CofD/UPF0052 family)